MLSCKKDNGKAKRVCQVDYIFVKVFPHTVLSNANCEYDITIIFTVL